MNKRLLEHDVVLDPVEHRYTDGSGMEYESVTKLLRGVKNEFDAAFISKRMAVSQCGLENNYDDREIKKRQELILSGWEQKRDDSSTHGILVHSVIEKYLKSGQKEVGFEMMLDRMQLEIFGNYKKIFSEELIPSKQYGIAGTADFIGYNGRGVLDILDWKTNLSKGIEYYSKYGKYFKDPVGHLSDCNYNEYCLQLSSYGKILKDEWNYKVRKLVIIFIPADCPQDYSIIPMPFMINDVKNIFENKVKDNFVSDNNLQVL